MPPPRRYLEALPEEIPDGGVNLRDTKYVLLKLLGKGAHGYAYLVRNPDLKRMEVMKILSDKVFELKYELVEEIIYRFKFEAQTLASIRNENVVHVNDIGLLPDGRPYFTMDYSEGVPLTQRLRQGQGLPLREALDYAIKMADGLAACHAKGVIHRDFKPSNVLVGGGGAVTIIDFGIAKKAQEHGEVHGGWTQAGAMLGTPAYMAPEQALGLSDAVGPATDVYALGTVIFVMLTGRLVFEGNTHDQIYHKLNSPEPSLLSSGAHVPPDLDALVSRMLAKDVSNRVQTASEVRSELQRIRKQLPSEFSVSVNQDAGFDAPTMDARYDTAVRAAAADGSDPTRRSGPPAFVGAAEPSTIDAPFANRRLSSPDAPATVGARPELASENIVTTPTKTVPVTTARPPLWIGALVGIAVFALGVTALIGLLLHRAPAETPTSSPTVHAPVSSALVQPKAAAASVSASTGSVATMAPPPKDTVAAPSTNKAVAKPPKPLPSVAPPTASTSPPPPATAAAPPTASAAPKPKAGALDDPF